MTEDPREFGLTATDLRAAADRLYAPADTRLDPLEWTGDQQARFGQIRSRLRGLADAIDSGQPGRGAAVTGRHVRPAIADQRAVLAVAAAILTGAEPAAAHDAAVPPGTCAPCVAVAALQLGFALCVSLAGLDFMTEELRVQLLASVQHAAAELEGGQN